jgi:fatty acid/phospholipid biosynthesis enzyme
MVQGPPSASWSGASACGCSRRAERVQALTDFSATAARRSSGFDRLFIKCHGRSRARAVGNAVKVAAKAVRDRAGGDRGRDRRVR